MIALDSRSNFASTSCRQMSFRPAGHPFYMQSKGLISAQTCSWAAHEKNEKLMRNHEKNEKLGRNEKKFEKKRNPEKNVHLFL